MTGNSKKLATGKLAAVGFAGLIAGAALTLNFSAQANKDADLPLPVKELRAFTDVFARIKSDYVDQVDDKKLITEAINGMVSGLDPHSAYLEGEEYKDLQIGTQGEFGGLGIEVGMEDGFVKVISPIEDTPAYRAGLKTGDLVIKLDDTPVKGMKLNDAVKRMRGKPGTQITLTILRKGDAKPFPVTLTRAVIKIRSVKFKLVEPGYGYVRITQFQEHTGELLVESLQKLYKENKSPLKGLVLDLRNDPGGLLNGAVAVSAAFIKPDSLVVYTEGRTEDAKMRLTASRENYLRPMQADYLKSLPEGAKNVAMVVLVNGGSASASEIVAGALQDHKRAIIMGTQTFGKGSVQTIMPLGNDAAIKLTTARYFTPSGRSIQAKGIEPDIKVEDPNNPVDEDLSIREADLEKHLDNPQGAGADKAAEPAKVPEKAPAKAPEKGGKDDKGGKKSEVKPLEPGEVVSKNDYQVSQALNLLKGINIIQNK
jgi:carboxyl-terminal processing protease